MARWQSGKVKVHSTFDATDLTPAAFISPFVTLPHSHQTAPNFTVLPAFIAGLVGGATHVDG